VKALGKRINSKIPGLVDRGGFVKWRNCWRCY